MTETALISAGSVHEWTPADRVAVAARRLYDAEIALHIARQTLVDAGVAAAYDRLHAAVCEHRAALAAASAAREAGSVHQRLAS